MKKDNNFAREIAKYYMDFLKTGFKKSSRLPKRQVSALSLDGGLVGINLRKYQKFLKDFKHLINYTIFENENRLYGILVPYNKYSLSQMTKTSQNKIYSLVEKIVLRNIRRIQQTIKKEIEEYVINTDFSSSSEYYFSNKIEKLIRKKIYGTVLIKLKEETPIEIIFLKSYKEFSPEIILEYINPLIERVTNEITLVFRKDAQISDVSKNWKYSNMIISTFNQEKIISSINEAIKKISSSNDLFTDIKQMMNLKNYKPNQAFYLYYGVVKIRSKNYDKQFPIMYIKVNIIKWTDYKYYIKFTNNKIYINKAALEFVNKELSKIWENPRRVDIKNLDKILKFDKSKSMQENLDRIYKKIKNLFNVYLENNTQETTIFTMRKEYFLWLFDQGDESLINDYEKITENEKLLNEFTDYILKHLSSEPVKDFSKEVKNKFDKRPLSEKLLFKNPMPLNIEQKLVFEAIRTNGCNKIMVKGISRIEKSHLITAIVFDSIINNKSCLILSDKKAALDSVEQKIKRELEKVWDYEENKRIFGILRIGSKERKNAFKITKYESRQALSWIAKDVFKIKKQLDSIIQNVTNNLNAEFSEEDKNLNKIQSYLKILNDLQNKKPKDFALLQQWFKNKEILEIGIDKIYEAVKFILDIGLNLKQFPQCWIQNDTKFREVFENIKNFYSIYSTTDREIIEAFSRDFCNNINYKKEFNKSFFSKWHMIMQHLSKKNFIKAGITVTPTSNSEDVRKQLKLLKFLNSFLGYWKTKNESTKYSAEKWMLNKGNKINNIEDFINILERVQSLKSLDFPNNVPWEIKNILWHKGKWRKDDYANFNEVAKAAVAFFKYAVNYKLDYYFKNEELLEIFNKNKRYVFLNSLKRNFLLKKWRKTLKKLEELGKTQEHILELAILDCDKKTKLESINRKLIWFKKNIKNCNNLQNKIELFMKNIESLSSKDWSLKSLKNIKNLSIYNFEIFNYFKNDSLQNIKDSSIFANHSNYFEQLLSEYEKINKISRHLHFLLSLRKKHNAVLTEMGIDLGDKNLINLLWNTKIQNISRQVLKEYQNINKQVQKEYGKKTKTSNNSTSTVRDICKSNQYRSNTKKIYDYARKLVFALLAQKTNIFLKSCNYLGIREKINNNQKLTKKEFLDFKKGFPCVIASIRDYAEIIPLEKNIYNLVIIDEASQIRTVQALTAILRAKKIIILDDRFHFSNVPSLQVDEVLNASFIKTIQKQIIKKINNLEIDKENITSFDVRNSILNFLNKSFNIVIKLNNRLSSCSGITTKPHYDDALNSFKLALEKLKKIIKINNE